MPNYRSMTEAAAVDEWVATGPGAGNGLDHVRRLFRVVYPGWRHGHAAKLAARHGVSVDLIQRVFKKNPAWTSVPTPRVLNELARALELPRTTILAFAFLADLHPDAVDEDMWRVLDSIAWMSRSELVQLHQLRQLR